MAQLQRWDAGGWAGELGGRQAPQGARPGQGLQGQGKGLLRHNIKKNYIKIMFHFVDCAQVSVGVGPVAQDIGKRERTEDVVTGEVRGRLDTMPGDLGTRCLVTSL